MAFADLLVTEIFYSLQGETSQSGRPFTFIRLTGCNLRCTYCDSTYAFKGGKTWSAEQILAKIKTFSTQDVLLTGGEPLLQRNTLDLAHLLNANGYRVSIETHGEVSIEKFAPFCRIIMDIKTPSSGMCRGGFRKNLRFLKPTDEIKFVLASQEDYLWAKALLEEKTLPSCEILFSAALPLKSSPGVFSGLEPRKLADQILSDGLNVRFQTQLHKILWGSETRGV